MNQDNVIRGWWDATQAFIVKNETGVVLALCLLTAVSLLLAMSALIQSTRLRREMEHLRWSTHRLITSEEKRILKRLADETERSAE